MAIINTGINIHDALMNLEFQLIRTQKILDFVLEQNAELVRPSRVALKQISNEALSQLQAKYPHADVVLSDDPDRPEPRRGLRRGF